MVLRFRASRLRDGLVVLQVVVCAVLLVCGALLYRRAPVFQTQDTGMRQQGVISVAAGDRGAELAAEFRTLADVEAVAVAHRVPWFGRLDETLVMPSGQSNPRSRKLQFCLAQLLPRVRNRSEERARLHGGRSARRSTGRDRQSSDGPRVVAG